MKETRILMDMHVTVEVVDDHVTPTDINDVFHFFEKVDQQFSPFKPDSEVSRFNTGKLSRQELSSEFSHILQLAEQTKKETDGYFDIYRKGNCDPCGIVKGWAIFEAAELLRRRGFRNFYVDAGGDIQLSGKNQTGQNWQIGLQHPFELNEIMKVLKLSDCGVATSGTTIRGQHIYNPKQPDNAVSEIVSLTVIGPNVYEADRFATACFAMGAAGIHFLEELPEFEGYMVDANGIATYTCDFSRYVMNNTENTLQKTHTHLLI